MPTYINGNQAAKVLGRVGSSAVARLIRMGHLKDYGVTEHGKTRHQFLLDLGEVRAYAKNGHVVVPADHQPRVVRTQPAQPSQPPPTNGAVKEPTPTPPTPPTPAQVIAHDVTTAQARVLTEQAIESMQGMQTPTTPLQGITSQLQEIRQKLDQIIALWS